MDIILETYTKKKSHRQDCSKFRSISAINSIDSIYGKVIKNRIEGSITDLEEQNGFRARRSCMDIFTLRQVIEKRIARNLETYLVFVYLTKAYDSVPLGMLEPLMR